MRPIRIGEVAEWKEDGQRKAGLIIGWTNDLLQVAVFRNGENPEAMPDCGDVATCVSSVQWVPFMRCTARRLES